MSNMSNPKTAFSVDISSAAPSASKRRKDTVTNRRSSTHFDSEGVTHMPFWRVFPIWFTLASRWFTGTEMWKARFYLAANVGCCVLNTVVMVQVSYAQRDFYTAMSGKDADGFYKACWQFVVIIIVAAPLFSFGDYIEGKMIVEWRRWFTQLLLSKYFAKRAYFNVKQFYKSIDNPDQRICDDVFNFVHTSTRITLGIFNKILISVAFTGVLWSISSTLVWFLLGYAIFGTWITVAVFGGKLMRVSFKRLQCEGDIRFDLVRVRENAESIAFYKAENTENSVATSRLQRLVDIMSIKVAWESGLSLWQKIYQYATILIPSMLTAPRYFAGEIEFGVINQASYAFQRLSEALKVFIDELATLAKIAAETERLNELFTAIVELEHMKRATIERSYVDDDSVTLQQLTFSPPNSKQVICKDLKLLVCPGDSVLIVGPSGCGKSSLMRVIAGLWQHGSGSICSPHSELMFFLPQKPFMPLGTLRTQLTFPSGHDVSGLGDMFNFTDNELLSMLDEVCLPDFVDKVGGLDADADWSHIMSLGEQQRVAFLRLLLHRPRVAFLDEATSAVDNATEEKLYRALQRHCRTFVSIGHRMQLADYHTYVLKCEGGGHWVKYTATEFKALLASN